MIRKSLLFIAVSLIAGGAYAEYLTPDQAWQRAMGSSSGKKMVVSASHPELAFTANTEAGEPAVYIFNRGADGGFMLLAADDVAMPVLGYSDNGSFDVNDMPPQLEYWLQSYSEEIAAAKNIESSIKTKNSEINLPSSWRAITPMVTSKWNQNSPYSDMTPMVGAQHCSTGCVATAMAQVMNYWKFPRIGTGYISYMCNSLGKVLEMYFNRQSPFDWDNMLDTYTPGQYSAVQANAVANLMVQCGYATQMGYTTGNSGTQSELVATALRQYFGYSSNTSVAQRLEYTATEWNEVAYKALQVGPVVFFANSPMGGHCFVMDGYDGNGYFHFNWGWGGVSDGFYLLNALNPSQQGIGGSFGGFNTIQGMVIGIQPEDGPEVVPYVSTMSLYGSVEAVAAASLLNFTLTGENPTKIGNDGIYDFTLYAGVEITNSDGTGNPTYVDCSYWPTNGREVFPPGSFLDAADEFFRVRFPSDLPDGKYMVRLVCKNGEYGEWKHFMIAPGFFDYIYVTKAQGKYTVENLQPQKLELSSAQIVTPLYYGNPYELELTLTNPYDTELTQSFLPYLYRNGVQQYIGENKLVTLEPNESRVVRIDNSFSQLSTGTRPSSSTPVEFDLVLVDYDRGLRYGDFGKVTMYASPQNRRVTLRGLQITNSVETTTNEDFSKIYGINNFNDINVSVSFNVTGGFLATPLTAIINEYDVASKKNLAQVYEKEFEQMVYLEAGETATETTSLNFYNYDVSKVYTLGIYYTDNGTRTLLGNLRFAASSGVDSVIAGAEGLSLSYIEGIIHAASESGSVSLKVFDAKGMLVAAAAEGSMDTSALSKGLYIVVATDGAGYSKTLKIAK